MDDELFIALLERAEGGSPDDIRKFLETLLEIRWIVPRKDQQPAMRLPAAASASIADVLSLESEGELCVPIFSSESLLQEWAGRPLRVREFTWESLQNAIPNNWWFTINPGTELSKDVSAWERELLSQGPEGISAIVDELAFADQEDRGLTIQPLPASEFPELRSSFHEYCAQRPEIVRAFLAFHADAEEKIGTVFVGAELDPQQAVQKQRISAEVTDKFAPLFIGGPKLSVCVGTSEHLTLQAIERSCEPMYQKPGSAPARRVGGLEKLLSFFRRSK